MKTYQQLFWFLALLGAATGLKAAEFNATTTMLCAVTQTVTCDALGDCLEGPAEAINLPVFFKVDPAAKVATSIRSGGDARASNILNVNADGNRLVLLGVEPDGGWSAVIDKATGRMTVTASKQGEGFLVFGSCLPD